MDGNAIEEIEFLARSRIRVRILELLSQESALTRDELRAEVDASRTTIQRNLDSLVEHGWIQCSNRTYVLVPCGSVVANEFLNLTETIDTAKQLQPFLKWVDPADFDMDLQLLREATITTAEPSDPWAMVNQHVERLKTIEHGRLLLPLTGLHAMEVLTTRVVDHGAQAELIVSPSVVEIFQTKPDYRQCLDAMLATGRFDVLMTEEEIPYYLGVLDDTVQIGADQNGEPRALLETKNHVMHSWASSLFKQKRESELTTGLS